MTEVERPTAAYILSLIAGVFILLGGVVTLLMGGLIGMMGGFGGYGFRYGYGYRHGYGYGMMGPGFGMMEGLGYGIGFLGILGVIFGVVVIISALMLNRKPEEHSTWGTLILIFSVLSIFGSAMGGFGIGLILGLIGGILAIIWKPAHSK